VATLADIPRFLDEPSFRRTAASTVDNAQVRSFWLRESESYPARFRAEVVAPVQNKVGAFLANPILQNILTQPKSALDLRHIMDERQILLVNLAKRKMGEDVAALLGALLASCNGLAGLGRADVVFQCQRRNAMPAGSRQTTPHCRAHHNHIR
jgi:hypothetical protein